MLTCLVTGAAGFIGSHLCERLLVEGHQVIGLDAYISYYPRHIKEENLVGFLDHPHFTFCSFDLRHDNLADALTGVDAVFHLAAMPGLLRSWDQFDEYMTCNVQATQRLLEASVKAQVNHLLYCSTSSVYGRVATGDENTPPQPVSPYGITKLAAEHLCRAYEQKEGLPVTILRLFSVYGPRQRPDMGYNIFIERLLSEDTIVIDGDGTDSRSNTFVADCVHGIVLAFEQPVVSKGETFNLGGGEEVNVKQVLSILQDLTGKQPRITYGPPRPGDQKRTVANINKARQQLGYDPRTTVKDGLLAQLVWQQERQG